MIDFEIIVQHYPLVCVHWSSLRHYCIARNFRGWKLSRISRYYRLPQKFYQQIFVPIIPVAVCCRQSINILFVKCSTLTNSQRFSCAKASGFTVYSSALLCPKQKERTSYVVGLVASFTVDVLTMFHSDVPTGWVAMPTSVCWKWKTHVGTDFS